MDRTTRRTSGQGAEKSAQGQAGYTSWDNIHANLHVWDLTRDLWRRRRGYLLLRMTLTLKDGIHTGVQASP